MKAIGPRNNELCPPPNPSHNLSSLKGKSELYEIEYVSHILPSAQSQLSTAFTSCSE